jgi:hypothetical protein
MTADSSAPAGAPVHARPEQDLADPPHAAVEVHVPLGRRVMVLGDLLLAADATPSSAALANDVARTLDAWEGPGLVVVCGNLFAVSGSDAAPFVEQVRSALGAHRAFTDAVRRFAARPDRRLLVIPGWRDPNVGSDGDAEAELGALDVEVVPAVDLHLQTAAGIATVLVRSGCPATRSPDADHLESTESRPWLDGVTKLEDPTASGRFVTSRVLYRRMGRLFVWVALLPALVVCLLRLPAVFGALNRLVGGAPGPHRALVHAYAADWTDRLLVAAGGQWWSPWFWPWSSPWPLVRRGRRWARATSRRHGPIPNRGIRSRSAIRTRPGAS